MNARRREREALRRAEKEARLARFEEKCGKLREAGYEQKECTVTIKSASVWGFALAIPFAAAAIALCFIAGPRAAVEDKLYLDFFIAAVAGMVCIPVHEGLHGLVHGGRHVSDHLQPGGKCHQIQQAKWKDHYHRNSVIHRNKSVIVNLWKP